ncbi:hypothetical protein AJ79_04675 [Helicocarpus griseus UAMH5409]|uniref:Retrovirus-related Pol polyprotein from transposon TNT 1-94-like beta-barrel domain-containing protein n=1 Tax=Helicocarpus griseus UAMH5409 TaxID=1447875 RepID=A0A2B7XJ60_9EURO|nr:hypothetical protein AJ79_04675 [Helicocarpus griseus UAMH5409]
MASNQAKHQADLRCPDWVLSNNSNVHVAKDRVWFVQYTPFKSELYGFHGPSNKPLPVVGIGTVEIITKRSPGRGGQASNYTMRLTNVLHAPSSLCNILGSPIFDQYKIQLGGERRPSSRGSIRDQEDRRVAYFDGGSPLFQLKLRGPPVGPPVGPHVIKHGQHYLIKAIWPNSEREKWHAHQTKATNAVHESDEYTAEERTWLKKHFRNEFHFLRSFGWNIYKDEHRAKGRAVLRAFKRAAEDEKDGDEIEYDEEEEDSDADSEAHIADYHFTKAELDFINDTWGNAVMFMHSYGLKYYDIYDCQMAKRIVEALMDDEVGDEGEDEDGGAKGIQSGFRDFFLTAF